MMFADRETRQMIWQLMQLADNDMRLVEHAIQNSRNDPETGKLDVELCERIIREHKAACPCCKKPL